MMPVFIGKYKQISFTLKHFLINISRDDKLVCYLSFIEKTALINGQHINKLEKHFYVIFNIIIFISINNIIDYQTKPEEKQVQRK